MASLPNVYEDVTRAVIGLREKVMDFSSGAETCTLGGQEDSVLETIMTKNYFTICQAEMAWSPYTSFGQVHLSMGYVDASS
jgi:hypothetical protein